MTLPPPPAQAGAPNPLVRALRAPFDWESYEIFIDRVMPAFRR